NKELPLRVLLLFDGRLVLAALLDAFAEAGNAFTEALTDGSETSGAEEEDDDHENQDKFRDTKTKHESFMQRTGPERQFTGFLTPAARTAIGNETFPTRLTGCRDSEFP